MLFEGVVDGADDPTDDAEAVDTMLTGGGRELDPR
jgi:hypothetical protein